MSVKKVSPFSLAIDLFHAQALLGKISMCLPYDSKYLEVRNVLFECSMRLLGVMDFVQKLEDNENL